MHEAEQQHNKEPFWKCICNEWMKSRSQSTCVLLSFFFFWFHLIAANWMVHIKYLKSFRKVWQRRVYPNKKISWGHIILLFGVCGASPVHELFIQDNKLNALKSNHQEIKTGKEAMFISSSRHHNWSSIPAIKWTSINTIKKNPCVLSQFFRS